MGRSMFDCLPGIGKRQSIVAAGHKDSPWFRNFVVMALWFSFNHSCVNAVYGLMSADFNDRMANASAAVFNFAYGLSSLFITVPTVKIVGAKWTMVGSATAYCCYVGAFGVIAALGAKADLKTQYIIGMIGSLIGGVGGGCIWTAQGAYFGRAAHLHSEIKGINREEVNTTFAGVFTAIFLGFATFMTLLSTWVLQASPKKGKAIVFIFYTICSIVGVFGLVLVKEPPKPQKEIEEDKGLSTSALICKKMGDIWAVVSDVKYWLLSPTLIIGGVFLPFLQFYLNGKLVGETLGKQHGHVNALGYLLTIPAAYACIMGVPYGYAARAFGKTLMVMSFGAAYAIITLLGLLARNAIIRGKWGSWVGIELLSGHTKAVYQVVIQAVLADFFPDTQAGAFAMNGVYGGLVPAIGNVAFAGVKDSHLVEQISGWTCIGFCGLSFICVPIAFFVHKRDKAAREANKEFTEDLLGARKETAGGPTETDVTKTEATTKTAEKSGDRKASTEAV